MYSTPDYGRFNMTPAKFFASRAKVYLDIELDSPSFATAQALLLLAAYEAAQGQDSRGELSKIPTVCNILTTLTGWVYIGMSLTGYPGSHGAWLIRAGMMSQVITDLGMHISSEVELKYIHEAFSAHEIMTRRKNFFWSAFTASV